MSSEYRGFADQLNIETPEQVDLRFPVAGIGSRFVALLIDHLIQFLTLALIVIAFAVFAGGSTANEAAKTNGGMDTAAKWFIAFVIFIVFSLILGYFALFEAFWHGQTPGKRIMKLRVIKDSGRQITLFEALARNLLRFFVDYLPSFYLAGVIAMLCNRKNKRLGDMAAGTLVVHELTVEDHSAAFVGGEDFFARGVEKQPESGLPADAIARLEPSDLHVIETFFARALDLDLQTRAAMAARIAARMAAKMGVTLPEGNPERALEAMAKAMRGSGRRF